MVHFLLNPAASSGRGQKVWSAVLSVIDSSREEVCIHPLDGPGAATRIAREITSREKECTIVAVGGDGTINEAINGIVSPKDVLFACIPTGSGNDFCRGMKLHTAPEEMARRIFSPGRICPVDLGIVSDGTVSRRFIVSSGIGWDAQVCYDVSNSRAKSFLNRLHLGQAVYGVVALSQILSMKRETLTVSVDDGAPFRCSSAYFTAAMNVPYEGGGFRFCPDADPGDGILNYICAHSLARPFLIFAMPLAFFGKHTRIRGIRLGTFRSLSVSAPSPLCVHTDGEHFGFSRQVTFSLHPEKLRVIL